MGLFHNRPLALGCGAFIAVCALLFADGALPGEQFWLSAPLLLLIGLSLLFFALIYRHFHLHAGASLSLGLMGAGILLGVFCCFFSSANDLAAVREWTGSSALQVEAVLTERSYTAEYGCLGNAQILKIDGEEVCPLLVSLSLSGVSDMEVGDRFTASLSFSRPAEEENGYPQKEALAAKGIYLTAEGEFLSYTGENTAADLITRLRKRLSSLFQENLSPDAASLADALLLGKRDRLSDPIKRDFRTLGISHLLAVSGLHLSILAGFLDWLLRRARARVFTRAAAQILFVLFYMALCGFGGSVTRAGIMYLILMLSRIFARRSDGITSLFTAGFLILLCNPTRVLDVGLQLSFLATLGILTVTDRRGILPSADPAAPEAAKKKYTGKLADAVLVGLGAIGFTLPVALHMNGSLALLSVPATILLTPIIALLLLLLPLCIVFSPIPFLSGFLFFLAEKLSALLLALTSLAKPLHSAVLPLGGNDLKICLLILCTVLVILLLLPRIRQKWIRFLPVYAFLGVALVGVIGCFMPVSTEALYFSSGKNEGFLLRSEENIALIDLSTGAKAIARTAVNTLPSLRSANVDTVILTHLHPRHLSFFTWLCENEYPSALLLPLPQTDAERNLFATLSDYAAHYGLSLTAYEAGQGSYPLGEIEFLPQKRVYLPRSTHPTIAFALRHAGKSLLYIGGAYPAGALTPPTDTVLALIGIHGPVFKEGEDTDYRRVLPSNATLCPPNSLPQTQPYALFVF